MLKYLVLVSFLLVVPACNQQTTPPPTPVIIVVTATPGTKPSALPTTASNTQPKVTPDIAGTPSITNTATLNLKRTDVKYVRAKQDINIRKGPGTNFEIVGGVYAGQTAQVTGYKSHDDQWWRVVCPIDLGSDWWVSVDTALTDPTNAPNVGPTATTTTEVNLEAYTRQLATALANKKYDSLRGMMGDPFSIGYWRSEGTQPTRDEALALVKNWFEPANDLVVDLAGKTDQIKLLDGTNPLGMWGPRVQVVKSLYVQGLSASHKDEALLIIAKRGDGSLYWYEMLFAGNGGFSALNR
jgi:hypothetical protein